MSKDINKQIEEAQYNFHSEHARSELDNFGSDGVITVDWAESCIRTAEVEAFGDGAKFVLNLNRWRKVSEEMPPINTFILINNSDGAMRILYTHEESIIKDTLEFYAVEYWMPIPERPIGDNQL